MIPPKRFDIFPPNWRMLRRSRCVQISLQTTLFLFLEKTLNASRTSEQPSVREKNVITFWWDSGFPAIAINVSVQNNGGFLPDIMVTHVARVWINRVRLPILLVVS